MLFFIFLNKIFEFDRIHKFLLFGESVNVVSPFMGQKK